MSPSKVEERLSKLEAEVTQLKLSLSANPEPIKPWQESIVGVFADDEAIAIGREYRRSYKDLFDGSEVK